MLNGPLNRIARQLEDLQRSTRGNRTGATTADNHIHAHDTFHDNCPARSECRRCALLERHVPLPYRNGRCYATFHSHWHLARNLGCWDVQVAARVPLHVYSSGFMIPPVGQVQLIGSDCEVDLRAMDVAELRSRIGLVTQEVQLFGGTVRDNLTLFDPAIADDVILQAWSSWG